MSETEKMTVTLPTAMVAVVNDAIATGPFASPSEVVSEALRDWDADRSRRRQEFLTLKADIDKGLADAEAGRVSAFDAADIVVEGRKLLAARSSA